MVDALGNFKLSQCLGEVRVGLRPDLEVTRHLFRGQVNYIIRDPVTLESHQMSLENYQVFIRLHRDHKLSEIFESLVDEGTLEPSQEDEFYRFVYFLHGIGCLQLPILDGKRLYHRFVRRRRSQLLWKLASVLFLRIPIFNPNSFLDKTAGIFQFLFSRTFFILWLLVVGTAGILAVDFWCDLTTRFDNFFTAGNLLLLWSCLIVIKVVHELGHAYACKVFGGTVPEMGVYLIALTPCAYVDASASWGFPRKMERIIVCLAGMYVELFLAAIAVFVWALTEPGWINSLMQNVIFLASVATLGFNLNPLMRFDGYYALSDILEIPNLRQRSGQCVRSFLTRVALGLKEEEMEEGLFTRIFLFFFGLASWAYRILIVISICAAVAMKLFLVGLLLGGVFITGELCRMIGEGWRFLFRNPRTRAVRLRAIAAVLICFGFLSAILILAPVSSPVLVRGLISAEDTQVVLIEHPGFVKAVSGREGRMVKKGELILELEDPGLLESLMEVEARLRQSEILARAFEMTDKSRGATEREVLEFHRKTRASLNFEREKLQVRAPRNGFLLDCLRSSSVGKFLESGDKVAILVSGRKTVETYLNENQVAASKPEEGGRVEFRAVGNPSTVREGTILRVRPAREDQIDATGLTQTAGGDIPVDPATNRPPVPYFQVIVVFDGTDKPAMLELRHGMTGFLRFRGEQESIAILLQRKWIRFMDRLRAG